jgi:hypothetical protein
MSEERRRVSAFGRNLPPIPAIRRRFALRAERLGSSDHLHGHDHGSKIVDIGEFEK